MEAFERESPAEQVHDSPKPPPPRPTPPEAAAPDPEEVRRETIRDQRVVNRLETESVHSGTMVDLLRLPQATIETVKQMDAVVRQQMKTNRCVFLVANPPCYLALETRWKPVPAVHAPAGNRQALAPEPAAFPRHSQRA